jgi:hypothetical protein
MLKGWMHDITLWIQARSGLTFAFLIWSAIVGLASLVMFVFFCVTGYMWLSLQLGAVFAGLAMAGVFLLIALIGAAVAAISRGQARQRALLERAARAPATTSWLRDPKILSMAAKGGRTLGWQRVVPLALLGFLVVQWVRENRHTETNDAPLN